MILVVDDERDVAETVSAVLARAGHACEIASTAHDAFCRLDAGDIELVLTDVRMPDRSGLDLLADIVSAHPEVGVLMMSGLDDPDIVRQALDLGAYGYIL